MKREWIDRYEEAAASAVFDSTVLTAFNANIDSSVSFEDLDIDLEDVQPEKLEKVTSEEDLKKVMAYCRDNSANYETDLGNFDPGLEGDDQLGGQAGIMANFLSGLGNRSIFYTPFLSDRIAELLDREVVYPSVDDSLVLENAVEMTNTDRTKENFIIEFEEESCRLILSDSIRGFGPYFRKSLEEKMDVLNEEVDRMLLSGFHDAEGNIESKFQKSKYQLEKIHVPKHLEFVSRGRERDRKMVEQIMPEFTSIGLDETEIQSIAETIGVEIHSEPSLGDVFHVATALIEETGLSRVHVHTLRFHTAVAEQSYPVPLERMRTAVLFGGIAAVSAAEIGDIPETDDIGFRAENMHLNRADDLEHFEDFFDLEDFSRTGTAVLDGYKIVAAPTIIHEDPARLVGLGDIISSGAFTAEIR